MENLTLKIRLSVLWIFMAVAFSAHVVFHIIHNTGWMEMPKTPGMLLVLALWVCVPLVMAFLSVTLKDSANRWSNIILGIVFTALNIFHLNTHLAQWPSVDQLLICVLTIVATALIAWYAWKWPKQEV